MYMYRISSNRGRGFYFFRWIFDPASIRRGPLFEERRYIQRTCTCVVVRAYTMYMYMCSGTCIYMYMYMYK